MKYSGGKGKCFQRLINLMPPHRVYIEPYLGGGAVFRNKRPADISIGLDIDPKVIALWQHDLAGPDACTILQSDAVAYLSSYTYTGDELVYADPPYLPSTRRREKVYRYDYSEADHQTLLEAIKRAPCMVMISGYRNALYDDTLSGWRKVTFSAKTHTDVREECVWMNFDPPQRLHDGSHLGHTFRDRQRIKRRISRFVNKLELMEPMEREALLSALNHKYGAFRERT